MKTPLRNSQSRAESAPGRRNAGFLLSWTVLFVVLLALVPAGCGGGSDDGTGPSDPPKPLEVGNGDFNVTTWATFNGCDLTKTFQETYSVTFDGTGFTMGDWSGTWSAEPSSLTASGESAHESVTLRDCTITTWTTVTIEFASADEFTGHVTFRRRAGSGTCDCVSCTDCQSAWGISGVRVVDTAGPGEDG